MKRVCVHSFFYYHKFSCVVGKKLKRYFNVSLKSVLFLGLFAANVAILDKTSSCFTITYCVKRHLRKNLSSVKMQLIAFFFEKSLFYKCFLTYFPDANQLHGLPTRGRLAASRLIQQFGSITKWNIKVR